MSSSRSIIKCPHCTVGLVDVALSLRSGAKPSTSLLQRQIRRQQFSTSPSRSKGAGAASGYNVRRAGTPSARVAMKREQDRLMKAGGKGLVPEGGMGVVQDTIVAQSIFKFSSGKRLPRFDWAFFKTAAVRKSRCVAMDIKTWWTLRKTKVALPLLMAWRDRREVKELATQYYKRFNEALAGSHDPAALKGILCEGLYGSLQRRVGMMASSRKRFTWSSESITSPRIISYRYMDIPDETGMRRDRYVLLQAIVIFHERQLLKEYEKDPNRAPARGAYIGKDQATATTAKDCIEYAVMNREIHGDEISPWRLWGFAQETTLAGLAEQDSRTAAAQQYVAAMLKKPA